jgi:hypothetical protein
MQSYNGSGSQHCTKGEIFPIPYVILPQSPIFLVAKSSEILTPFLIDATSWFSDSVMMFIYNCILLWPGIVTPLSYAQNSPPLNWIIFTNPPPFNGSASSRLNFTAGQVENISWTPGSSGPEGLILLRLTGDPQNVNIAPDIVSEYLSPPPPGSIGRSSNIGYHSWYSKKCFELRLDGPIISSGLPILRS